MLEKHRSWSEHIHSFARLGCIVGALCFLCCGESRRTPSPSTPLHPLPTPPRTGTHLKLQGAGVRTHCFAIRAPPQKCCPWCCRLTSQGHERAGAARPPTIRGSPRSAGRTCVFLSNPCIRNGSTTGIPQVPWVGSFPVLLPTIISE